MRTMFVLGLIATLATTAGSSQVIVERGGPGGGQQMRRMNFGGRQPALEESPADYGVTAWRVGQFARYSVSVNMGGMPMQQYTQVSVVGRQGEQFWVETMDEFAGNVTARVPITKMLIAFGPLRERVGTEIITMSPDSAIYRRTMVRAASGSAAAGGIGFPSGWTRVGEEQVNVAAGAFRAVHWRKGEEHLWTSAEAGPMGLVKYESDNTIVELTGKGDNARSRIPYGG